MQRGVQWTNQRFNTEASVSLCQPGSPQGSNAQTHAMEKPSDLGPVNYEAQGNGGPARAHELEPTESRDSALQKIRTAGSVSIPPELFEKLYLSPHTAVKGDLRKTFGNPTPL